MKHGYGSTFFGFIVFVCFAVAWQTVHHFFGQAEAFRVWGIGLLVVALVLSLKQSIPLRVGNREPLRLIGWRKILVLLPVIAIGIVVSFYPHQVACSMALKGYKCSGIAITTRLDPRGT